jgi:hypothetical protein
MHHLYNAYILVSTGMHRPFRASALGKTSIFRLLHLFIVRGTSIDSHETDPKTHSATIPSSKSRWNSYEPFTYSCVTFFLTARTVSSFPI